MFLDHVSVGSWDTVVTLLKNAGQYQQIELEVMTLVRTMGDELKRALDQLNMYHALTSLYPAAARTQHRVNMYSLWGSKLMENFGTRHVTRLLQNLQACSQHVKNMNMQLEQWY